MPKATKLHAKGKSNKSMQKSCNNAKDSPDSVNTSIAQYQLELCWCIQQLERFLEEKKGSEKQMQDAWKVLMVLKNNDQPHIRKRQLMRTHFGDYRAKMAAEEEKKLAKMASKMKIVEKPTKGKAKFLRKSVFLTTGDNSFRFNFKIPHEEIDTIKDKNVAEPQDNVTASDANNGNTEVRTPNVTCAENTNLPESAPNKFKFTISESEFKFNFNLVHD